MARSLRAVVALGGALLLGMAAAQPATAATGDLVVEVVGGGPLFDVDGMYPGLETTSLLRISNATGETGRVQLRVTRVVSDDNGCNRPEARVDSTCGDGEGELGDQVRLTVERRLDGGDHEIVVSSSALRTLATGVPLEDIAAGASDVYRLTLALPSSSGNETQTDSVAFEVEIVGQALLSSGAGGAPTAPVAPELLPPTKRPPVAPVDDRSRNVVVGETIGRSPADPAERPSEVLGAVQRAHVPVRVGAGGASLPRTGSDIATTSVAGLAAVAAGSALAGCARRHLVAVRRDR